LRTAERLRRVIAETAVESEAERLRVTASFGVAFCPEPGITTQSQLIEAADAALYRAKRLGRNRVEVGGQ
jgi:diguanylate cyclase (GGDEF)-like protein